MNLASVGFLNGSRYTRLLAVGIALLFLAYLIPALRKFAGIDMASYLDDTDGLRQAAIQTFGFALCSSVFNVVAGLSLAIGLSDVRIQSRSGILLGILIVPVLVGNVSTGFLGKFLFESNALVQSNRTLKFLLLLFTQFWQFGTLYVYLFWLLISNISPKKLDYARVFRLPKPQVTKDIILPACLNLAIFLLVFNLIVSLGEMSKAQLIFKSTRGTDTEMMSQWLQRTYQSFSLISQDIAAEKVIGLSTSYILASLIGVALVTLLFRALYLFVIRSNWSGGLTGKVNGVSLSKGLVGSLIVFVLGPIILLTSAYGFNGVDNINEMMSTLWLTLVAAVLATSLSVFAAMLWRYSFRSVLATFNSKSVGFVLLVLLLQLIPSVLLLYSGYQWFKEVSFDSQWQLKAAWVASHVVLAFPILSSFTIASHFRITNNELSYLDVYRLGLPSISNVSFIKRFRGDYLLTLIIAFSLIWNEYTINSMLSDFVPSFVSKLKMAVTGRGADIDTAVGYFYVSVLLATASFITWTFLQKIAIRKQ